MLQGEVAWRIHQRWLRRVAFLRRAEHDFIIQVALLASHLTLADVTLSATLSSARPDLTRPCLPSQVALLLSPMVFAPGELAASGWLYIVHRGIALYGGKVLTAGKVWNPTLALRTSLGRRACPLTNPALLLTLLLPRGTQVWGEDVILTNMSLRRNWTAYAHTPARSLDTQPLPPRVISSPPPAGAQARDELFRGVHALPRRPPRHGGGLPGYVHAPHIAPASPTSLGRYPLISPPSVPRGRYRHIRREALLLALKRTLIAAVHDARIANHAHAAPTHDGAPNGASSPAHAPSSANETAGSFGSKGSKRRCVLPRGLTSSLRNRPSKEKPTSDTRATQRAVSPNTSKLDTAFMQASDTPSRVSQQGEPSPLPPLKIMPPGTPVPIATAGGGDSATVVNAAVERLREEMHTEVRAVATRLESAHADAATADAVHALTVQMGAMREQIEALSAALIPQAAGK